jgi:hypothetical protein
MGAEVVPPCLELGDGPEHAVLAWMSRKAKKNGVVPYEYDRLIMLASRGVYGTAHRTRPTEQAIHHLSDGDYIGKVDIGTSWGMEVLVRCFCSSPSGEDRPDPCGAAAKGLKLSRSDGFDPETSGCSRPEGTGTATREQVTKAEVSVFDGERSALRAAIRPRMPRPVTPFTALARDFFPQLMREHGHTPFMAWPDVPAFSKNIRDWHEKDGITYDQIRLMMEEFALHPEWCRRSNQMPWKVFLSRRDQIASLISTRMRRDPSRREPGERKGQDYWFGSYRPTSLLKSLA